SPPRAPRLTASPSRSRSPSPPVPSIRRAASEVVSSPRDYLDAFFLSLSLSSFFSSVFWNLSGPAVAQSPAHELMLQISSEPLFFTQRLLSEVLPRVTICLPPSFISKVRVALGASRPVSAGVLPSPKSAALRAL